MKNIVRYLSTALVVCVLLSSCETTELDLADNPNALTPSQADPDFYLNAVQLNFVEVVESLGETGAEVTRIENMFGRNYQNNYSPTNFDNNWETAYQETLINIRDMNTLAEEAGLTRHIAIGQFIEAYTITLLVDFFGDVPYTEALTGAENLNPALDTGASIYAAADALLDQAIANFGTDAAVNPDIDFFYDNDEDQWIRACNTLKLRLAINTGDIAGFNALISAGNYIQDADDDLQFAWGTNQVQPDTRHPNYAQNYTNQGGGDYGSIWLMNLMDTSDDPRIRYYYYRQSSTVPGSDGTPPNEETLDCSLQTPPAHYVSGGFPFCTLPNGYWGRDHGNDNGIPPDGLLRVAPGVYPVSGLFDDSRFEAISLGAGGGGNGITPLLLSSWVSFWQAEVAMLGSSAAGAPFLTSGITQSITKVQSFGSRDDSGDLSMAPSQTDVDDFIASVDAAFTAADDTGRWNILAEQFFIALKGNGHDSYNFYRRRGFPTNIQPNVEPDPGAFIRSFFYPANFANNNSSVDQKTGVTGQVFWDTNPASPGFPIGN